MWQDEEPKKNTQLREGLVRFGNAKLGGNKL
jgi:hypothetical protein